MAVKTTRAPVRETASKAPKKQLAGKPAEPTKAGTQARKRSAKPTAAKPRAKKERPVEKKPAVPASSASQLALAYAARAKSETPRQRKSRAGKPVVERVEPVSAPAQTSAEPVAKDAVERAPETVARPVEPVAREREPVQSPRKRAARVVEDAAPAPPVAQAVEPEPPAQPSKSRRHLTLVEPLGAGERDSAGVVRTESGVGARAPGGAGFDVSSVDLTALLGGSKTEGGAQAATTQASSVRTAAPVASARTTATVSRAPAQSRASAASAQVAAPVVLPVESEARRDAYENVLKRLDESEAYERNSTPSLLRTRVFAGISLSGAALTIAAFTPLINGGWAVLSVVAGAIAFYTAGENFLVLCDDRKRSLSNQAPSSVSYAVVRKAVELARVNGLPFEAQTFESKIDIVFDVLRKLVEERKPKDVFAFIASNERVVVEALRSRIERDKLQYIEQHLIPSYRNSIERSLQNLVYASGVRFLESSRDYLDFVMGELFVRVNPSASFADVGSEEKLELLNQVRAYVESPENKRELAELLIRTFKAFCEREITAAELKLKSGQ